MTEPQPGWPQDRWPSAAEYREWLAACPAGEAEVSLDRMIRGAQQGWHCYQAQHEGSWDATRRVIRAWDGEGDYEWPVEVGQRIRLTKGRDVIVGEVTRAEGHFPDCIGVGDGILVDLVGWTLEVL